jgi:hypothetical protein
MQTRITHTSSHLRHVSHVDGMSLSLKSWLKLEGSYDKYGTGGVCS